MLHIVEYEFVSHNMLLQFATRMVYDDAKKACGACDNSAMVSVNVCIFVVSFSFCIKNHLPQANEWHHRSI